MKGVLWRKKQLISANWSQQWLAITCLVLAILLLSGCSDLETQIDLNTKFNVLGGGRHEMVLCTPVDFYDGKFDTLLTLLSDVQVRETADGQGIRVSQPFYRLEQLNRVGKEAHFVNRVLPSEPLDFQVAWQSGFFTRDLQVRVFINPVQRSDLVGLFSSAALYLLDATLLDVTFALEMPGQVIHHNGSLVGERTVVWILDVDQSQTLEATARVVNVPMLAALVLALGIGGVVLWRVVGRGSKEGKISTSSRSSRISQRKGRKATKPSKRPPPRSLPPPRRR